VCGVVENKSDVRRRFGGEGARGVKWTRKGGIVLLNRLRLKRTSSRSCSEFLHARIPPSGSAKLCRSGIEKRGFAH